MSKLLAILTVLIIGGILLALAIGYANTQATERNYSEASIIRAQAESRLTTATAGAITTAALLPWFALATLGVLGLAIMALARAIVARMRVQPGAQTIKRIETRIILYLPTPGASRREVWQALSDRREEPILIELPQREVRVTK